jgi:hypothetical protein
VAVTVQVATLLRKVLRKRRPVTTAGVYSKRLVSGCEEEWIGYDNVGLISTSDRTWHLKGLLNVDYADILRTATGVSLLMQKIRIFISSPRDRHCDLHSLVEAGVSAGAAVVAG